MALASSTRAFLMFLWKTCVLTKSPILSTSLQKWNTVNWVLTMPRAHCWQTFWQTLLDSISGMWLMTWVGAVKPQQVKEGKGIGDRHRLISSSISPINLLSPTWLCHAPTQTWTNQRAGASSIDPQEEIYDFLFYFFTDFGFRQKWEVLKALFLFHYYKKNHTYKYLGIREQKFPYPKASWSTPSPQDAIHASQRRCIRGGGRG